MFLDNQMKAMLLTIGCLGILIVGLISFKMNRDEAKKELLMELDVQEQLAQIKEPKPEPPKPIKPQTPNQTVTNEAFDESKEVTEKDFANRLQDIKDRNAQQREALESANSSGTANVDSGKGKKENTSKPVVEETAKQTTSKYKNNRRSNISYYLPTRTKVTIPNPIYTCDKEGTVVINVTVNQYGHVTKTDYNKSQSTTSNGCLIDEATYYAERARFSEDLSRESQKGTITYQFQN